MIDLHTVANYKCERNKCPALTTITKQKRWSATQAATNNTIFKKDLIASLYDKTTLSSQIMNIKNEYDICNVQCPHHVHELIPYCFCLALGAEQVVYSELFLLKTAACCGQKTMSEAETCITFLKVDESPRFW